MNEHINKVKQWYEQDSKRIFIISGYAGCGKTTLARKIPGILKIGSYRMLAPTGKAALVLGNAQTIHSYLYHTEKNERTGELHFFKKDKTAFTESLLIIDEISMVNKELLTDLYATGIPMIGLGDPAQLPPVQGKNDILNKPDIFLTKVYRNAGGLLEMATDVRLGNVLKKEYENVSFRRNSIKRDLDSITDDTIIICRYNKTRKELNSKIRTTIKKYTGIIEIEEKLMVLNNSQSTGLMNGSIVTVTSVNFINKTLNFAIVDIEDAGGTKQTVKINLNVILGVPSKLRKNSYDDTVLSVDYAYAITCHKAQGSEFDKVLVVVEGTHYDDFKKWYYTAITRAKSSLYIYKSY